MSQSQASTAEYGGGQTSGSHDFRQDIEGLRAISILAVILFHIKVPGFAGGFVGVDVFFVISGFLVTRLILAEVERSGRLDVLAFWGRRARRLLPNALLTLLCTLLLSLLLMPAYRLPQVMLEIGGAALYAANLLFLRRSTDYFTFADAPSPVLHFWSLAVEEQFYIVWPLAVLLILRVVRGRSPRQAMGVALAAVFAISLAGQLWAIGKSQPMAFFNPALRAWQLAAGGLLAVHAPAFAGLGRRSAAALSLGGAAAVALALLLLSPETLYPGVWALGPTLGAAAIIAGHGAGFGGPLRAALSTPLMGLIGRRSYSLYLWHWPVEIFAEVASPEPSLLRGSAVVAATILAAELAFRFVEEPVRRKGFGAWSGRRYLWAGLAGSAATAAACGLVVAVVRLAPGERAAASFAAAAALDRAFVDRGRIYPDGCHLLQDQVDAPPCLYGDRGASRRIVLFGDSHAAQWFEPLDAAARETGWALHSWTKTGCPSIDAPMWFPPRKAAYLACSEWREKVMARLIGPEKPDLVVLSNLWDYAGWLLDDRGQVVRDASAAKKLWIEAFRRTIARLEGAGIPVLVIRDTPRASPSYRRCLVEKPAEACGRKREDAVSVADIEAARNLPSSLRLVDLTDRICDPLICPVVKDGRLVYMDEHHINATFALTLAPALAEELRDLSRRREPPR